MENELILRLSIPIEPRTKKNNQEIRWRRSPRGKVPYITQGKAYREYERDCLRCITGEYKKRIDYPVNIKAVYYMGTNGKVDLTNLHSALCDVLVAASVLRDDNKKIVAGMDGSRVYVDRKNPRTEIEITRLEENTEI